MVKRSVLLFTLVLVVLSARFVGSGFSVWSGVYHLEQEWVKIWVNQDGTIDLFYNISLKLDSGDEISRVYVGQPNGDFTINQTKDQDGHILSTSDASSGDDFKVQINLASPLRVGETVWFTLTTNVAHMIHEDNQNTGNVGMQFKPTWWQYATVHDLRVSIVLPLGVNESIVKTMENWTNASPEPDGRLSIYWQRMNLLANQQYTFGVSFPKQYVQHYDTQPSGLTAFFQNYGVGLLAFGVFIVAVAVVVSAFRKRPYLIPSISMESLGIRHGLTAVEASYLLDLEPTRIVTEILYSLLQKRAIWVESTKPSLKIRIMKPFENKTGTQETHLRYYEIDFLKTINEDGMLDEEKLAQVVMSLRDNIEEKLRGYCRQDTIEYYANVVSKAWEQVKQAGTSDLASKAYDEQLLWLLLDSECKSKTESAFRDRSFEPNTQWLWFWYGYHYYYPNPTYTPNVGAAGKTVNPPVIPGSDFANNVAAAIVNTSNNFVVNLEKFANSILPMSAGGKASHDPAHHEASCVCACAACACACACVSCACACAGGGVG